MRRSSLRAGSMWSSQDAASHWRTFYTQVGWCGQLSGTLPPTRARNCSRAMQHERLASLSPFKPFYYCSLLVLRSCAKWAGSCWHAAAENAGAFKCTRALSSSVAESRYAGAKSLVLEADRQGVRACCGEVCLPPLDHPPSSTTSQTDENPTNIFGAWSLEPPTPNIQHLEMHTTRASPLSLAHLRSAEANSCLPRDECVFSDSLRL